MQSPRLSSWNLHDSYVTNSSHAQKVQTRRCSTLGAVTLLVPDSLSLKCFHNCSGPVQTLSVTVIRQVLADLVSINNRISRHLPSCGVAPRVPSQTSAVHVSEVRVINAWLRKLNFQETPSKTSSPRFYWWNKSREREQEKKSSIWTNICMSFSIP